MDPEKNIEPLFNRNDQFDPYKELITYGAGTSIFEEDEKGTQAYFIQSGYVELSKYVGNKKKVVALLGPGEIFGEISLIDGKKRTASATASHESILLCFNRQQLMKSLSCEDPLTQLLLQSALHRIRGMHEESNGDDEQENIFSEKNMAFIDSKKQATEHISTLVKLSTAVEQSRFQLHYQPIINFKSGCLNGFEVLVRGPKDFPELFSPLSFIPLAEESGLIVPLGEWILHYGLKSFHMFNKEAFRCGLSEDLFISINISPRQLQEEKNVEKILDIIRNSGVERSRIKLEITENILISDPNKALSALNAFKSSGVKIAIDDFGTGYSSLNYLNRYPMDTLKIDRSFISELSKEEDKNRIVKGIISLAHILDMNIVAEGVETVEHHDWLMNHGCEYGQGYYYNKPLDFKDAIKAMPSRF